GVALADRARMPRVERLQLLYGERVHATRAVGGAVDLRVVHQDEHPGGAELDVDLDAIGAVLHGRKDGGKRVLGQRVLLGGVARAAMADGQHGRRRAGALLTAPVVSAGREEERGDSEDREEVTRTHGERW